MQIFKTRKIKAEDLNFVTSSWLKSFRGSAMFKGIPNESYYRDHQNLIKDILVRADTLIAANPEDEEQILGWICTEHETVMHYIYVKEPFRHLGIAAGLIQTALDLVETNIYYTHYDKSVRVLIPGAIYNPYLSLYKGVI